MLPHAFFLSMFSVSVVEAFPSLLSGHQLFERSGPPSYPWHGWKHHDLVVDTTSGPVRPLVNTTYPDVEQYLGIPFAAPPIGSLRFGAPQQYSKSSEIINATEIPPSCYQLAATSKNIFDVYEPGFGVQGPQSEDCLKLDLYRPSQSSSKSLPVLIFVYGGAFVIGGANQLYEMPTPWVQHKQDLIVVNIQYRVGYFGFPNSAALSEQNLGLQDIRFAVKWIHENVAAFGGDPNRMTLWGQSAGSIAANAYTYTYIDNPIIHSTISTSGTVFTPRSGWQSFDTSHSNFTFIAIKAGCSGNAEQQLACVRTKPAAALQHLVNKYQNTTVFKPVIDEKLVFSNYSRRAIEGKIAKQPAILGSNRLEGERLLDDSLDPHGPNQTVVRAYTVVSFLCPAELTAKLRHDAGVPTYRYEYKGNFSNISPLPWMGAYHGSPLPLLFGTTNVKAAHPRSGKSTPFELAVGSHMQDLWRAFTDNPDSLARLGWPLNKGGALNQTTDAVKLFPGNGHELSSVELGGKREQYCALVDPYLISQTLPPSLSSGTAAGGLTNGT